MRQSPGKPDTWGQQQARKRRLIAFERNKSQERTVKVLDKSTPEEEHNFFTLYKKYKDPENRGTTVEETILAILSEAYFQPLRIKLPLKIPKGNSKVEKETDELLTQFCRILLRSYNNTKDRYRLEDIREKVERITGISDYIFFTRYIEPNN